MACYRPVSAWQTEGGGIVFAERGAIRRALTLPCGQCVGCRLERSRAWAMRCVHEAQLYDSNSFVTLTYDDDHCPSSLRYSDFQKFAKRLRKAFPRTWQDAKGVWRGPRFFMCGEYGERLGRPHFHACLFGVEFQDKVIHSERGGFRLYRSDLLSKLWPLGFSLIGDVTFDSAAYVARYVMKKITGPDAQAHYQRVDVRTGEVVQVVPEFCRMSLKPGLGAGWIERYRSDVFGKEKDSVVVNGVHCKPPRFYREWISKVDADLGEDLEFRRYVRSGQGREDRTPERLAVREAVAKARLKLSGRTLE